MINAGVERTKMLRGLIMAGLLEMYPLPSWRHSVVAYMLSDLKPTEQEVDGELHYLEGRGLVKVGTRTMVLGRQTQKVELTPTGVDVARGIDPENPFLPDVK